MTVSSMRRLKHSVIYPINAVIDSRNDRKLDEEIETSTHLLYWYRDSQCRNDRKLDEEIETCQTS